MGGKDTYNDKSASSLSSDGVFRILVRERQIPVSARQAAESADEGEEDEEEGDVCAERADEEDEADESFAPFASASPIPSNSTHVRACVRAEG